MKKILLGLTLLSSMSTFACTCMSTKNIIAQDLAEWQQVEFKEVKISNLDTTITPLAIPTVVRSINSCDAGCSLMGTRVTANVEYKKNGQTCTAELTKPARYESRLSLDDISCI